MNKFLFKPILFLFISFLMTSCASMTPDTAKRAYCNMLKSDIVFNGATSVTRQANIDHSERPLQQYTYEAERCDDHVYTLR